MGNRKSLRIEFTDILYAAVISTAISRLSLRFNLKNFMLLFALLIIFDDWLDYHISISLVKRSPREYFIGYILDILILITWHFITVVPPFKVEAYLLFIIVFFILAGIWDITILKIKLKNFFRSSYFKLSVIYLVLLTIHSMWLSMYVGLLLGISVLIFVIMRASVWKSLPKKLSLILKENGL